jgi:hypothetical protein
MRKIQTKVGLTVLAVIVVVSSVPIYPCGRASGQAGAHDHGQTPRPRASTKAERTVQDLLADPLGRAMLRERVMADEQFMRELFAEIARLPEWRAFALDSLDSPALAPTSVPAESAASTRPANGATVQATYHCPMHPEVTATAPGTCPKCGMALIRAGQ